MKRCSKCLEEKPDWDFHRVGNGYLTSQCKPCRIATSNDWKKNNKDKVARYKIYNKKLTNSERKSEALRLERLKIEYNKAFDILYECFKDGMLGSKKHLKACKEENDILIQCNQIRSRLGLGGGDPCQGKACSKCTYYIRDMNEHYGESCRLKGGCDYKRNVLDNNGVFKGFMRRNENYVKI